MNSLTDVTTAAGDLSVRRRMVALEQRAHRGGWLLPLYRLPKGQRLAIRLILCLEGGFMFSRTLRRILKTQHDVAVGLYTYGPCLRPGGLPRGTRLGRYTSLGSNIAVYRRNHPKARISLHPFFYNPACGLVASDTIHRDEDNPLEIGSDVWIGASSVVLPGCRQIGDGAIIGAGAIVTRDVPAFSVVGGNPARIIGQRFSDEVRAAVEASRWWDWPIMELVTHLPLFLGDATREALARISRHEVAGEDDGDIR